jgi:hypothetical protein
MYALPARLCRVAYVIIAKNFVIFAKFLMSSRRDLPAYRIGLYKKEDSYGLTLPIFAALGCAMNRSG